MSSFVKCFDAVSMVVEEATNQFSPLWKLDKEKYRILEQYCQVIDGLSDEFDGISYDVEIDDIAMTIAVTLECQDINIQQQSHKYYALAQRAVTFGFSTSEDGNLNVKFVFPSVWNKV